VKNFDQERAVREANPTTFQMGGETFSLRASVRPEALSGLEEIDEKDSALSVVFGVLDTVVKEFLVVDDGPRWDELRQRPDSPVGIQDISSLVKWLTEEGIAEISGRPTEQPGGSSAGQETTETTSTGGSSSPDSPAE
jgi:hypothetical protein